VRLILACSALVITFIDPSEPDRLVFITYTALLFYAAYGVVMYSLALRSAALVKARAVHWIDVGWCLLLISLSSGTSSIFFFFLFYAVLVASFRWGFREGMLVTVASAVLFTIVGYATAGQNLEINRFLLRPVYLLVLGYLMAYWGGAEIDLKRRLALLKEVNTLSNPRFGVAQTVLSIMKRVRAFYGASRALLILYTSADAAGFQLIRVEAGEEGGDEVEKEYAPVELARQFLTLPETFAACYNSPPRFRLPREAAYTALDVATNEFTSRGQQECAALAVLLDANSFVTLPLIYRGQHRGRFFLTRDCRGFDGTDLEFLQQIVEHVMPVLSNVRLLDQLASKAAEHERQKIARDLHDSVIQPYIGLQYKLAAIRNKLSGGSHDVTGDLDQLFDTTVSEITGLRHYVRELRDKGSAADHLVAAIRRYTEQFQENYGINVEVVCQDDLLITDRLAAELIQMVHEGLRNAWKHTEATHCVVRLESVDNNLVLCIENNNAPPRRERAAFTPRSLTERTASLGGRVSVEHSAGGQTVICARIPL
jgi:signal transduction histidine kinase